jgi:hypothetical protein
MPTVVNVHGMTPNDPGVIYVGRACAGWHNSPLANPYKLAKGYTDDEALACLEKYRRHLWLCIKDRDWKVMRALRLIQEESKLGCWCSPRICHGDVIIRAWRWCKSEGLIVEPTERPK